jgi:hypothetical protein
LGVTYGDNPEERICRVIRVRDVHAEPLALKTVKSPKRIQRGRFLVTCQDTHGQIRSFYSGVGYARKLPILRAALLKMKGKLPARVK